MDPDIIAAVAHLQAFTHDPRYRKWVKKHDQELSNYLQFCSASPHSSQPDYMKPILQVYYLPYQGWRERLDTVRALIEACCEMYILYFFEKGDTSKGVANPKELTAYVQSMTARFNDLIKEEQEQEQEAGV
jgi:hypothetical protein